MNARVKTEGSLAAHFGKKKKIVQNKNRFFPVDTKISSIGNKIQFNLTVIWLLISNMKGNIGYVHVNAQDLYTIALK